ncbi:MAG: COG4223 family protein [Rhizomicrobium sp.]
MTDPDTRPFAALPAPDLDDGAGDEPRQRRSIFPDGALGIFVLLIVAAVSGGLIASYWPWVQSGGTENTNDRIATLETRVAQIAAGRASNVAVATYNDEQKSLTALRTRLDADEARLTAMENGQPGGGDATSMKVEFDQMGARLARLEQSGGGGAGISRKEFDMRVQNLADASGRLNQRVALLEKTAPAADLAARLDGFALKSGEDALDARIARLEGKDASEVMKRAATLLALVDLARASANGEGFATELSTLRALQPGAPELPDLARYASQGAPASGALSSELSARADSILAAERASHANGWSQKLWANLSSLVSIRRIGDASGDSTESRLARAGMDLRGGDVAGAVNEVGALKGAALSAARPWLVHARARLAVDRDTRALTSRVLASMALPEHS